MFGMRFYQLFKEWYNKSAGIRRVSLRWFIGRLYPNIPNDRPLIDRLNKALGVDRRAVFLAIFIKMERFPAGVC